MAAILARGVDAIPKPQPYQQLPSLEKPVAKAEGLTVDEASELAAWLKETGYTSVEFIREADYCSVHWSM